MSKYTDAVVARACSGALGTDIDLHLEVRYSVLQGYSLDLSEDCGSCVVGRCSTIRWKCIAIRCMIRIDTKHAVEMMLLIRSAS